MLAWVVIESFFSDQMMLHSIDITVWLQKYQNSWIIYFNYFWYKLGLWTWLVWPFIAMFVYSDKPLGLKTFSVGLSALWFKNCIKLFYLEARPNLISDQILPLECKCEFGKPSGTLTNTSIVFMLIIWDLWSREKSRPIWSRSMGLLVGFLGILMLMFSLLWFGFHSYNQMIYSILLSTFSFQLSILFEDEILEYWHTLITHNDPIKFKKYLKVTSGVC